MGQVEADCEQCTATTSVVAVCAVPAVTQLFHVAESMAESMARGPSFVERTRGDRKLGHVRAYACHGIRASAPSTPSTPFRHSHAGMRIAKFSALRPRSFLTPGRPRFAGAPFRPSLSAHPRTFRL